MGLSKSSDSLSLGLWVILRHFSLLRHNPHCSTRLCAMARYKCIDWLIDWISPDGWLPSTGSGSVCSTYKYGHLLYLITRFSKQATVITSSDLQECLCNMFHFFISLPVQLRRCWFRGHSNQIVPKSPNLPYTDVTQNSSTTHLWTNDYNNILTTESMLSCSHHSFLMLTSRSKPRLTWLFQLLRVCQSVQPLPKICCCRLWVLRELLSGHAWQSTVSSCKQTQHISLLIWMLSANFWSPGTVMENTRKKDWLVMAIMEEGCPGVMSPHFLTVWQSKEVVVHLCMNPQFFTVMLTATAACYGKLLTRLISRRYCHASTYVTQSQISEMVLWIRQTARKMLQNNTLAWPQPSWKQQSVLKPLTCCRQTLQYFCLQRTVSRHSIEISCYNSASGWHPLSLPRMSALSSPIELRSHTMLNSISNITFLDLLIYMNTLRDWMLKKRSVENE